MGARSSRLELPRSPRKGIWIPPVQLSLGQTRHDSVRVSPGVEWGLSARWLGTVEGTHQETVRRQDSWHLMGDP